MSKRLRLSRTLLRSHGEAACTSKKKEEKYDERLE